MPQPNEHHQRLAALAGSWRGREKMFPSQWDPNGSEADAEVEMRVVCGGFNVVTDYRQIKDGQVVYSGHGIYSIDPASNEVVLDWFDAMGGQREEFRGSWNGDVLTIQSKSKMGHMRLTYDHSEPGTMKNGAETSPDGDNWTRMFEGLHERQS